ncbi:MAG TPA: hypothetical protein VJ752_11935 [Burkholderiaceae bacterium]|nr:hypothetical protein [Burkholderiaceae bacterium]
MAVRTAAPPRAMATIVIFPARLNFFRTDKKATAIKNLDSESLLPPRDSSPESLSKEQENAAMLHCNIGPP